jgi:hypothetical protein
MDGAGRLEELAGLIISAWAPGKTSVMRSRPRQTARRSRRWEAQRQGDRGRARAIKGTLITDCPPSSGPRSAGQRAPPGRGTYAAQLLDAFVRDGGVPVEAEDTRRLNAIREVLKHFDWEFHDRQLALEAIERIVEGGQA